MSHYHKVWQRYAHDESALKPERARVAEQAMDEALRKKEGAYAAWAYVKAQAVAGCDAARRLCVEYGVRL